MAVHLNREVEQLKKDILALGGLVEEQLQNALKSFTTRDRELAKHVCDNDDEVDSKEVELEEDCLKILALHQPVAVDLRFIVAVLKINNELERIGDLAVNIAETANILAEHDPIDVPAHFDQMLDVTRKMVADSLNALVDMDDELAHKVLANDQTVDDLHASSFELIQPKMQDNPARINDYVRLISISRTIERIADHATNIAEDVIYLAAGEIVRHQVEFEN